MSRFLAVFRDARQHINKKSNIDFGADFGFRVQRCNAAIRSSKAHKVSDLHDGKLTHWTLIALSRVYRRGGEIARQNKGTKAPLHQSVNVNMKQNITLHSINAHNLEFPTID